MTNKGNKEEKRRATAKRTRRAPSLAPHKEANGHAPQASRALTQKQALALWELILTGDGKPATRRAVKLDRSEVEGLESARLITIESGRRKKDPSHGSKVYLTDEGWSWANGEGFQASLAPSKAAVPVLAEFLKRVGNYLKTHDLALDHLLRPKRAPSETSGAKSAAVEERNGGMPAATAPRTLEERVRAAYLRVTGGALNEYVRLALLRAELRDEHPETIDAELRGMQKRGIAVLYPIDDPQRLRPEDDAAALRVLGERRDLFCIKG
jgi:hypothetical protein